MKLQVAPEKYTYYTFPKMAVLVTVVSKLCNRNYSQRDSTLKSMLQSLSKEKPNIITVAWHSPISFKPSLYGISIDPKRYSHELILNSKEFVVNFAPWEIVEKLHYCGRHSGENIDKFKETGLTAIPAHKVKPPLIKECYAHLECALVDSKPYGDHTLFVGKIVAIAVNEECFNEILKPNTKPIYYLGANTYTTIDTAVRERF